MHDGSINLACGPVGVPNHAPIPLLALYLKTSPRSIVSAQVAAQPIREGHYVDPASAEVEEDYVLDPHDPARGGERPAGLHRGARRRLLADLPALLLAASASSAGPSGGARAHERKADRAPLFEAGAQVA